MRSTWVWIGLAPWLALGCGGDVDGGGASGAGGGGATGGGAGTGAGGSSGGTGASGGTAGGTGGGGTTGGAAGSGGTDACSVITAKPLPLRTTFRFTNTGSSTVYLDRVCDVRFDVTSCRDSYTAPLALSAPCTKDCADTTGGCLVCGACLAEVVPVPPGQSVDHEWSGRTFTFGTDSSGCQCHVGTDAPAGLYRIAVELWDSEPQPGGGLPPYDRTVTQDFALPAADDVLVVDLSP